MQPTDKIEWRKNFNEEINLLEYISLLEEIYIPDLNYDTDNPCYYRYQIIRKTDVSAEEWEEIENTPFLINVSETLQIFAKRYNNNLITEHFSYSNYIKHPLIQTFIKELELDVNKFWMLILFIYDYSFHYYKKGTDTGESPNEQLLKFVNVIKNNVISCEEKTGATFSKPISLKINIEGERNIIIDNPNTILYIAESTSKMMNLNNNMGIMSHKRILKTSTPTKDSPFIAFFAQMFLDFFNTQPQVVLKRRKGAKHSQKEIDLVCQLIAFTKLSNKSCWTQLENETLKAFLKQYKNFEPSTVNSIYPEVRI